MDSHGSGGRRWFGAIVLGLAIAMLIAGETLLKGRLAGLVFLAYWLGCIALTGLAMLVAIIDLRAVRRRTADEQRLLVEDALKEIQAKSPQKRPQTR